MVSRWIFTVLQLEVVTFDSEGEVLEGGEGRSRAVQRPPLRDAVKVAQVVLTPVREERSGSRFRVTGEQEGG